MKRKVTKCRSRFGLCYAKLRRLLLPALRQIQTSRQCETLAGPRLLRSPSSLWIANPRRLQACQDSGPGLTPPSVSAVASLEALSACVSLRRFVDVAFSAPPPLPSPLWRFLEAVGDLSPSLTFASFFFMFAQVILATLPFFKPMAPAISPQSASIYVSFISASISIRCYSLPGQLRARSEQL